MLVTIDEVLFFLLHKMEGNAMLKLRLMGTKNDIKWFNKFLSRSKNISVLQTSEFYQNKGTKKYYRVYVEIEKNKKS